VRFLRTSLIVLDIDLLPIGFSGSGVKQQLVRLSPAVKSTLTIFLCLDAGCAFMIYLGLLILLMRQIEPPNGRTPTGMYRVSRWSFLTQAVADGILFIGVSILSLIQELMTNKASLALDICHVF